MPAVPQVPRLLMDSQVQASVGRVGVRQLGAGTGKLTLFHSHPRDCSFAEPGLV